MALDDATTRPLYFSFVKSETNDDYALAISTIKANCYTIKGVVIDGRHGLISLLSDYKIQMCQFHMKQIIIRYLTKDPRIKASMALLLLVDRLPRMSRTDFEKEYEQWKTDYDATLRKRSTSKVTGKTHYTHRKLRGAMKSIDFFLPYLFTYQLSECEGMPNTNNKIEGVFTDLKKNLNNHSGMTEQSRNRFIKGVFLALEGNLHIKRTESLNPLP